MLIAWMEHPHVRCVAPVRFVTTERDIRGRNIQKDHRCERPKERHFRRVRRLLALIPRQEAS
jgi:hypothetical protein